MWGAFSSVSDPDPDPRAQKCGSGSETLGNGYKFEKKIFFDQIVKGEK